MPNVSCNISSCAHNKYGICYATSLNISGINATNQTETTCASYLHGETYSNIANMVSDSRPVNFVSCNAINCKYNYKGSCSNDSINVINSIGNNMYSSTECASFESI